MSGEQESVFEGVKDHISVEWKVPAPWGEADVHRQVIGSSATRIATKPLPCETPLGPAEVTAQIYVFNGADFPTSLQVNLGGGMRTKPNLVGGMPRDTGRLLSWDAEVAVDIRSGKASGPAKVTVTEATGEACQDVEALERVRKAMADLTLGWSLSHQGYAARLYGTLARHAQQSFESEVEHRRKALLEAANLRDAAARMVRAASHPSAKQDVAWFAGKGHPLNTAFELRGFAGGPVDQQNLDEVVAYGPTMIHAETMSDTHTWMGVYFGDGRRLVINFGIAGKKLVMGAYVDDEGMD